MCVVRTTEEPLLRSCLRQASNVPTGYLINPLTRTSNVTNLNDALITNTRQISQSLNSTPRNSLGQVSFSTEFTRRFGSLNRTNSTSNNNNNNNRLNNLNNVSNTNQAIFNSNYLSRACMVFGTNILCLLGLAWQLYVLFAGYFQYHMVSEIYLEKFDKVVPPAFSLCFPYVQMINLSTLGMNLRDEDWSKMTPKEITDNSYRIQKNLSVDEIFDLTYDLRDIITDGFIRELDAYEVEKREDRMDIKKYVKDDLICYRIIHADQTRNNFHHKSHHLTYGEEAKATLSVTLNKSRLLHVTKVLIYLHLVDMYPRGDRDFPLVYVGSNHSSVFAEAGSYLGISYSKYTMYLLPPPYKTSCINYNKLKNKTYESQVHCIHYCMRDVVREAYNLTSFTSTFTKPRRLTMLNKFDIYNDRGLENEFEKLLRKCKKTCPHYNCTRVFFTPSLLSVRDSKDVTLVLYDMNGLEWVSIFQPKTTLIDLFVQILSVTGVWMGLSCVDMVISCTDFIFKTVVRTYNSRQSDKNLTERRRFIYGW